MLKSEVFRNKRLVKDRRRSKKIKKQINYRAKTHNGADKVTLQGLSIEDLEKRRKKNKKGKKGVRNC